MASILIADDHPQNRQLVSRALHSEGHSITVVGDVSGAWRHINIRRPDMVLLNCLSEDFDSFELLLDIKRMHPDYPVLVYVADTSEAIDSLKETIGCVLAEKQVKVRRAVGTGTPETKGVLPAPFRKIRSTGGVASNARRMTDASKPTRTPAAHRSTRRLRPLRA
ncbi:MAG: response regulator [Desulfobacterales bacterium]